MEMEGKIASGGKVASYCIHVIRRAVVPATSQKSSRLSTIIMHAQVHHIRNYGRDRISGKRFIKEWG